MKNILGILTFMLVAGMINAQPVAPDVQAINDQTDVIAGYSSSWLTWADETTVDIDSAGSDTSDVFANTNYGDYLTLKFLVTKADTTNTTLTFTFYSLEQLYGTTFYPVNQACDCASAAIDTVLTRTYLVDGATTYPQSLSVPWSPGDKFAAVKIANSAYDVTDIRVYATFSRRGY